VPLAGRKFGQQFSLLLQGGKGEEDGGGEEEEERREGSCVPRPGLRKRDFISFDDANAIRAPREA
jgi:hypothetical protein